MSSDGKTIIRFFDNGRDPQSDNVRPCDVADMLNAEGCVYAAWLTVEEGVPSAVQIHGKKNADYDRVATEEAQAFFA